MTRHSAPGPPQPIGDERLLVFVKAPRAGFVKTRVAEVIGPVAACSAYARLAEAVFRQLEVLPNVDLVFSPDDAEGEISKWLRPGWTASPQGGGSLGERMDRAFTAAFRNGAKRVALIGSDCPDLTAADVQEAWTALSENDLAVGPAEDGGYWLIGLTKPTPSLFADMRWSSETVLRETLERAKQIGLRAHLLRRLSDVDTAADWECWKSRQARAE